MSLGMALEKMYDINLSSVNETTIIMSVCAINRLFNI